MNILSKIKNWEKERQFKNLGFKLIERFGDESIWAYKDEQAPYISFLNQRIIDENNIFIELFGRNKEIVKQGEKTVKETLRRALTDQDNVVMHITDCISIIDYNDAVVKQVVDAKENLNNVLNTMFFIHIDEQPYTYNEFYHKRKLELIEKSKDKSIFFFNRQRKIDIIQSFFKDLRTT